MPAQDPADPSLELQARRSHHYATWARTFHSRPEVFVQPESVEEVQKIIALATKCRRRLVTVGAGHSPSDLTCTSSWMVDLSKLNRVLEVNWEGEEGNSDARVLVQAGIYLRDLSGQPSGRTKGLVLPSIGSIDHQSIAGAIATATHGSSHKHGLLSQYITRLRIVLADGRAVWCSPEDQPDLFRTALVSLGAVGIITEVEYRMFPDTLLEWDQSVMPLSDFLDGWDKGVWTQAEFVRCWWMPYMRKMIIWKADKTNKPKRKPKPKWYAPLAGFHVYQSLLWLANYFPRILPTVEWYIFGMQLRSSPGPVMSGVDEKHKALLMDCLFSQFVNEWAIPWEKGPEAIDRLSKWISRDEESSGIPFSAKDLWVHCPIEVRITDGSKSSPRAFLDPTRPDGRTLYLNATLYRPYYKDPPCTARYYEAFEWLMKQYGGRPHWAKNFSYVSSADIRNMYGEDLDRWMSVRNEVDPEGMFLGAWHRRNLFGGVAPTFALEEKEIERKPANEGGHWWYGAQAAKEAAASHSPLHMKTSKSEESFDSFGASTESGEELSTSDLPRAG